LDDPVWDGPDSEDRPTVIDDVQEGTFHAKTKTKQNLQKPKHKANVVAVVVVRFGLL
jgi:hypothetical protein